MFQSSTDIKDVLLMKEKQKTQKILLSSLNRDQGCLQFNMDIWVKWKWDIVITNESRPSE